MMITKYNIIYNGWRSHWWPISKTGLEGDHVLPMLELSKIVQYYLVGIIQLVIIFGTTIFTKHLYVFRVRWVEFFFPGLPNAVNQPAPSCGEARIARCFIFMFFLETAMTMSWSGTKDLYGFVLWGNQVSKHVGHLRFLESVGHFIGGLIRAGFMNHDVWQMYRHWWLKCSTEHSKRPHKLTCMHACMHIYIDADIDTHIHQQRQISCMLVICMHVCLHICMLYHEISQI